MHFAEALLPRDEAVSMAARELRRVVDSQARYYLKAPEWTPEPERPVVEQIRALDAWYYIPFARRDPGLEPLVVRVNGMTKVVVVDRSF